MEYRSPRSEEAAPVSGHCSECGWDLCQCEAAAKRMRKRARVDANQREIREALESVGWKVKSTASLGDGFPDLICARGHDVRLVEVKQLKGKLTEDQQKFIVRDGWPVKILYSVEDALNL